MAILKEGQLVNGVIKEFYKTGKLHREISLISGKRNGLFTEYYPSGILKTSGIFTDNQRDGEFRTFYTSGKIKNETNYKKNQKINSKNYDEYGNLIISE